MSAVEWQVVTLTNVERRKAGCPAVRADSRLALAARRHSTDMGVKDYFGHTSKGGSSFGDRAARAGYRGFAAAENFAAGQSSADAVVQSWMNSEGHRNNILNCGLRHIGVGEYSGVGRFGHYWTQMFGS